MAANYSLKSVRELVLLSYADDLIDDEEYIILNELNESRESYPYWKYDRFDINNFDDAQCQVDFRFKKNDLATLVAVFGLPEKIITSQRTVCSGLEGLCVLLKRLAFPCRYTDMASLFGRNPTEICLIFNTVIDFMYETHCHRLKNWNQPILQPQKLKEYCDAIYQKGSPLNNCFGFIDGTVRGIARPEVDQRVVYNGHKKKHALKYQSLVLPNGLVGNFARPYEGRKHDATMLYESGLLVQLENHAWFNRQPLCIYGDPAYRLSVHLQAPFRNANITPDQHAYNKAMSAVHVSVEWLFGLISNYFKLVDFQKMQKVGLSAVGKIYVTCALLQNAHTCLYGNIVSEYFDCQPPTLQQYFA